MGDGFLNQSPDELTGGEGKGPAPCISYSAKYHEVFPYYLAIGMSYEQFWEGDCSLVIDYRKAQKLKQELMNQQAWLHGMYVYEAIADVSPILQAYAKKGTKPRPYRDQPYELHPHSGRAANEEKYKRQDDRARVAMEMFAASFNQKFMERKAAK